MHRESVEVVCLVLQFLTLSTFGSERVQEIPQNNCVIAPENQETKNKQLDASLFGRNRI